MKKILIIGSGRSASSLIDYLLKNAAQHNWQLTVADVSLDQILTKTKNHPHSKALQFDVNNPEERNKTIQEHDLIISMLPAFMHGEVAKDCLRLAKHLFTASYVSELMRELDQDVRSKGLLFMNEAGLDPGIDHASAMKIIHEIQDKGGDIISFKSYCGGLVAPESNDNPWGYKFSWNPRNVILAGQGTAQYLENGRMKFIPYNRLFTQTDTVEVEGYGNFDAYANRDSISYQDIYRLKGIKTMLRGTLRMPGYCKAWNVFVKLGLTDDCYKIHEANSLNYTQLIEAFLPEGKGTVKEKLQKFMGEQLDEVVMQKLEWLGLFNNLPVSLKEASPAMLLQNLLENKWVLKPGDKDMIVMQHQFEYVWQGQKQALHSSLVVKGDDEVYTAMAKTVGLPLAITVKLFLTDKLNKLSGVQIPVLPEIYQPMLAELEQMGIKFTEKQVIGQKSMI